MLRSYPMQDQKTLMREKWAEALEQQGDRQCRDLYMDKENVCAMGLFIELGIRLGFIEYSSYCDEDGYWYEFGDWDVGDYSRALKVCGIDSSKIIQDNDFNKLTFQQIATKLRTGGYDR